MIKEFNVSDSALVNLRGEHRANRVWAKDVVLHEDDLHYGLLYCDDIYLGVAEGGNLNHAELEEDDRIYYGVVHVRAIIFKSRRKDECTETDV